MRTIIITGASEGIGRELARQIAARDKGGAALVLAARNAERLEELAIELRAGGTRTDVIPTDVTDKDACRRLIAEAVNRLGRIDVLVNNAGMSAHANFEGFTDADLDWSERLMVMNYWSVVWLTQAALPHLLASKGLVVGVSSVAGLVGVPGRTAYCATKFAMNGFLEALRAELAPKGLRVMIAYPGTIDTDLRKRGFGPGGAPAGVSMIRDDRAMPVETCARLIREGMQKGRREVLMTPRMKLGRWLRLLAPQIVDRLAMKEVKAEYRP
ncbi:SDR family oxidoreductase [Rhizobium glycinendophyticum]|uniref:SDR family oxidoreductase n=1 Tax=Rhizobium glycinendophyticum TaxID=2589807 RepID=A0A504URW4_9HYPH|nr:SDR family oxidoreductase [Rhizobium glycinendophyticum]TPP09481.1 SDR family oxidoreductase [Rhizobium glycinendophyticum]